MKDNYWILIRDNEVRYVFKNRKEAVTYFKALLEQTLKDFDKQDSHSEYDYTFIIPKTEIKQVIPRESYLSLV